MTLRCRGASRDDRIVVLPRADTERCRERLTSAGGGLSGSPIETLCDAGPAPVGPPCSYPSEPRGRIVLQVFAQLEAEQGRQVPAPAQSPAMLQQRMDVGIMEEPDDIVALVAPMSHRGRRAGAAADMKKEAHARRS